MAFFEWDDSIALGIPTVDAQHKALFGWINTLDEAVRKTLKVQQWVCIP